MISYLASPKSFTGHIGQIQLQAIRSWLATHPEAEVILYGGALGDFAAAEQPRVKHAPAVSTSATGAPHFDAIARHAAQTARFDRQVYLNCDILLPSDFAARIAPVSMPRYLIVGQRIDLAEGVNFDATSSDWLGTLRALAADSRAELHTPTGVDYFVFPRDLWAGLAPLVVGRGGYDGALIAFALRRRVPLIDATRAVPVLHQYHDYAHVAGGLREAHRGTEALENFQRHDVLHSTPDISDADLRLCGGRLIADRCRGDWLRAWEVQLRYRQNLKYTSYLLRAFWRIRQAFIGQPADPLTLDRLLNDY